MSERYYVVAVEQYVDDAGDTTRRPVITRPEFGLMWSSIPISPTLGWCLALIDDSNHSRYRDKPGVVAVPDGGLDNDLGAIGGEPRAHFRDGLQSLGCDLPTFFSNPGSHTLRQALDTLGTQIRPDFNVETMPVNVRS